MKSAKKFKPRSDRYYAFVYALFRPIFVLIAKIKFGVKAKPKKYSEPIVVLSNHTTDLDFTTIAAHIKNHLYYVCSQHIFAMGLLGKLFRRWFNPIGVFKGSIKASGAMEIIRRVKRGNSILMFPEGRISYNGDTTRIDPSTAKLVKKLGVRLITYRNSGGFFKQPRWQSYINKGSLFSYGIVNEYSAEDIAAMTDTELLNAIRSDLQVDAYALQSRYMHRFPLKRGVVDITRYYDVCPFCHGVDTLSTNGDTIKCNNCGYEMRYDEYGYLFATPSVVKTVKEWEVLQTGVYVGLFEKNVFFCDRDIELYTVTDGFVKKLIAAGNLSSDAKSFNIGDVTLNFDKIEGMEVLEGGSALVMSESGTNYLLRGERKCLNKYMKLWEWNNARDHSGNKQQK